MKTALTRHSTSNRKAYKMRGFILAMAMLASIQSAHAGDKSIRPLLDATIYNLALSYFCQTAIGVDAYRATQTEAADILTPHLGYEYAIIFVNEAHERLMAETRLQAMGAPDTYRCGKMKAEAMRRLGDAQARLDD